MFQSSSHDFKSFSRPLAVGLLSMVSLKSPRALNAQKLGLSSSFGDVTLQNVALGTAYPLQKTQGHGYSIKNLSEVPVDLVIEVAPPINGSLRPYYEPLSDLSWVTVTPARVHLGPGASAEGEVTILVPNDPGWRDRNFQCALYTHTLQGSFVNVGIYDKLLFSTGAGPDAARGQGPHLAWLPGELRVGLKPDGSRTAAAGPARLELLNASESSTTVHVASVAASSEAPKGYVPGDAAELRFDRDSVVVQAGQTLEIPFTVKPAAGARAYRVKAHADAPSRDVFGWVLVGGEQAGGTKKAKASVQ